jgi:predicted DNA-binding protein YlxM (UPF0122 family)
MNGTVYIIRNIVNSKVYIGSTSRQLSIRMREHKCRAGKSITGVKNYEIYKEMVSTGFNNFYIEPLATDIELDKLKEVESLFIETYYDEDNLLNRYKDLSKQDIDIIIREYNSGLTMKQIGSKYSHCKKTVSFFLKKNGILIREWNEEQKIKIDDEVLKRLYIDEFMTSPEIAKMYNTSPQTISKHLKKMGITMRRAVKRIYL